MTIAADMPAERSGVVTLGETMALLAAQQLGPLAHVTSMAVGMGGAESNVAIALQRLGVPATWIGCVGADSFGDLILREHAAEGVRVVARRDPDAPTGLMVKERRTARTVRVWYYRLGSAGAGLRPDDVPEELIARARVLHVTGITPALSDTAAQTVQHAVDIARRVGTITSLDVNYRSALWSREAAGTALTGLAKQVDLVFAGQDEAALIVPHADDPLVMARDLAALGPTQVLLKLGERGCAALVDGEELRQPAVRVEVVDTVGAGDAFVAGYLAELIAGEPVRQRLLTAVTTGAFACTGPGDWEGLPRRHELALLAMTETVSR